MNRIQKRQTGTGHPGFILYILSSCLSPRFRYLDEAEKKKMMAAHSDLLRKFTELAFDEAAEMRWQESRPAEADNIDVGPAGETDVQSDLMEASGDPF
jgi:hypothetical protein